MAVNDFVIYPEEIKKSIAKKNNFNKERVYLT